MSANTAKRISELIVDRVFKDHYDKCATSSQECKHEESGSLPAARLFESCIRIGDRRAILRVKCPYSLDDPDAQIKALHQLAKRIVLAGINQKFQVYTACIRIATQLSHYAERNAMQVIADAAR